MKHLLGKLLFYAVILAIVVFLLKGLGIFAGWTWLPIIFIVVGALIGLINIDKSEAVPLMIAVTVIGGGAGILALLPQIGGIIEEILIGLASVTVPAGIVVALKTFLGVSKH